jgi:hypothetical protein
MPLDRGIVDQQLQALGESSRWWDRRELRDLPAVLHEDEQIIAIARGKIARVRWLRRPWLIVVTQQRLLCLRSGSRTSWRQIEANASQITRVSLRVGLFRGRVLVAVAGHTYRLLVPRADAYKLQSALTRVSGPAKAKPPGFAPTRMVHRVIDHVLALPAVALSPEGTAALVLPAPVPDTSALDERVQALEQEVFQLSQQVDFLEQLLRQRQMAADAVERLSS